MDDLAAQLATSFAVSNEPNTTAAAHPRFSQYKSKSTAMDQNSRRMRILEKQKQQRFDYVNHIRSLSEDTWSNADAESVNSMDSLDAEMETESSEMRLRKPGRYYKNQLMLSEWLVDVPVDFTQEWCTVPCPVGKRCLVVASRGHTCAYTRSGYRLNTFTSTLPGGNKKHRKENAILDCIYDEVNGIYYILDIMCWKNHPVYDSDTEFRFFWLRTRIDEYQNVTEKTKNNPYRFIPVPNFAATEEGILNAIDAAQFELDGLLFYHKKTHYTFGSTPLVVWLKPFMIPEILGFNVPEKAMAQKPSDYVNYQQHMINFEQERERLHAERQAKGAARASKKENLKMKQESSLQEDQEGEKAESTTLYVSGNSKGFEHGSRKYKEKAQRMERRQYGDGYRMDVSSENDPVEMDGQGDAINNST